MASIRTGSTWRIGDALGTIPKRSRGRGGAVYFDAPFGRCALQHYRRGGMIANLMGDPYLWTGAERTRGFKRNFACSPT